MVHLRAALPRLPYAQDIIKYDINPVRVTV